ncbi:MAG: MFS transporter [Desulfitobacteriaceae bacterium]|nr:MFS transporter [Desulfitobacteriaceae bacterium]MDI6878203.1 MFS transporter [Desulfitobacteriaceae bacterium]MDI6913484.1 MFS transporter [Desulfitobacteriaceae bacterium]
MAEPESSNAALPKLWTRDFILIALINLIIFLGFQMLMPTLPFFVTYLGGSNAAAGLVIGVFAVSSVLIRPFAGKAIDTYGRKGVFLLGLVVFLMSVLAYHWLASIVVLMLFRFIHGLGWGASSTAGGTIAADVIPKKRLAEGMSFYGLASNLSMAIGPALGLYLIQRYSFGALFFSSASTVVLALLFALVIHYQKTPPNSAKVKASLFEKSAFRPSLIIFFVTMTYGAIVSFLALYTKELGIGNIGPFFTVYALTLIVVRPVFGKVADRRGYNIVMIPGLLAVLVTMILISKSQALGLLLTAAVIYGIGFGAVQPTLQAMAVQNVPFNRRGAANGTFYSAFDLGIGLGSGIWGTVAQFFGYSQMYLWAAVPAIIAFILYLTQGRQPRPQG